MKNKVGRNDKCPCGSGLKYKKCCLRNNQFRMGNVTIQKMPDTEESKKILEEMNAQALERTKMLEQYGLYINFVSPIIFKGNKVWCLGSRVYPKQPPNETFHEFIMYVLRIELGKEWWMNQLSLPEGERHFVFKCYMKHYDWREKNETLENKYGEGWRAEPDGYSLALLSLAYDVCSLLHAVHLPDVFLNKLRKYEDYQSVRYEIAVSAMFARMGYKIRFLDEELCGLKNQPKHCEFIATDSKTGEEIAIEVKSKIREGVLHTNGVFDKDREPYSDVAKLLRSALEQRFTDKPFIVFVDMNLPLSSGLTPNDIVWVKKVTDLRDRYKHSLGDKPSPTNAIFFTNYSYHYGTNEITGKGEWLSETSGKPEVQIVSPDFWNKLFTVINNYGKIPNLDVVTEI